MAAFMTRERSFPDRPAKNHFGSGCLLEPVEWCRTFLKTWLKVIKREFGCLPSCAFVHARGSESKGKRHRLHKPCLGLPAEIRLSMTGPSGGNAALSQTSATWPALAITSDKKHQETESESCVGMPANHPATGNPKAADESGDETA